jgi:hypothetical protein
MRWESGAALGPSSSSGQFHRVQVEAHGVEPTYGRHDLVVESGVRRVELTGSRRAGGLHSYAGFIHDRATHTDVGPAPRLCLTLAV